MGKSDNLSRLTAGKALVSDGATGTNLQKMGLPVGASAEVFVLENPAAIRGLTEAFIEAGADIVLTCTFGGTKLRLAASSLEDQFEAVNRKAVALAQEAAEGTDVLVGGSIGPIGHMLAPMGSISVEAAEADFAAQARLLCDGGVDLIVIETQFDINEASAAVRGVRSVDMDIPLVCSFSYDRGTRTMMGVRPSQMAETIGAFDVDVLGINCGRSLEENLDALGQLRAATDKPLWFKPNAGLPVVDEVGQTTYSVSPAMMGDLVPQWIAAGAQIVGGCCGTSPEHLAAIAAAAKEK